jgi:hypothetical protein
MDVIGAAIALALLVVPLWRILRRAGLTPALSLIALLPAFGFLIVSAILAYTEWPPQRNTGSE